MRSTTEVELWHKSMYISTNYSLFSKYNFKHVILFFWYFGLFGWNWLIARSKKKFHNFGTFKFQLDFTVCMLSHVQDECSFRLAAISWRDVSYVFQVVWCCWGNVLKLARFLLWRDLSHFYFQYPIIVLPRQVFSSHRSYDSCSQLAARTQKSSHSVITHNHAATWLILK